jgi:regulation of enolase protein 1 (concanavalin A-like superfamily)
MNWYNEPPAWSDQGRALTVTTGPKSDFWRKTHYGFIRDNGHFYYENTAGDFVVEVKIEGKYHELYDQAGLMLRADEQNWIKTGIEYVDGVQHVSAVVTREYSDWSVIALPHNPAAIWLRVTRKAEAVEIFYSLDGVHYTMMRLAYLTPVGVLQVGPMCASPDGGGFDVRFEGFNVRILE